MQVLYNLTATQLYLPVAQRMGEGQQLHVQHETNPAREQPSRELIQAQAQLEEVTSRITQLEARLQSVRIIDERKAKA